MTTAYEQLLIGVLHGDARQENVNRPSMESHGLVSLGAGTKGWKLGPLTTIINITFTFAITIVVVVIIIIITASPVLACQRLNHWQPQGFTSPYSCPHMQPPETS